MRAMQVNACDPQVRYVPLSAHEKKHREPKGLDACFHTIRRSHLERSSSLLFLQNVELRLDQLEVFAAQRHQLLMVALLDNVAVIED